MKKNAQESRQLEHISTSICNSSEEGSVLVAREISDLIRSRNADGQHAVLGLATGSTPIGVYRELVRLHKDEGLSFKKVLTFNLDEYHGLEPEHPESYAAFMDRHGFDSIEDFRGHSLNYFTTHAELVRRQAAIKAAEKAAREGMVTKDTSWDGDKFVEQSNRLVANDEE